MKIKILLGLIVGTWTIDATAAKSAKTEILDVRTPAEYSESYIQGAVNIDFLDSSFKDRVEKLSRDTEYLIYCRSGNRSAKAIDMMKALGFSRLKNLGSLQEASKTLNKACQGKSRQC